MVVAVDIASPRISWRLFASSRMWVLVSWEIALSPSDEMGPVGCSIEALRESAVALASMVAVYVSISTLAFHSSNVCSGMGYWNIGTLGGCGDGGTNASAQRTGREIRPSIPVWSKKAEGIVCVSPICCVNCLGSQSVR